MPRSLWVFGLTCVFARNLFAQDSTSIYGPIEVRNLRALQVPFFRFTLHGASLPEGEREWNVNWNESNDMRVLRNRQGVELLREDQETTRFTFSHRKGLSHGMEFGIDIPVQYRGGGIMDKMINWWHDHVIHSPHPDRDSSPVNQSIVRYPGGDFEGPTFGLGDVSLTLSKTFGHRWRGTAALKLPTGDPGRLLGSGSADGGLSVDYNAALRKHWSFFLQGGLIAQGKSTLEGARGYAHQEGAGLIWHPNSRDAYVAQWISESAAIQTGIPASDATHRTLVFGYERRVGEKSRLDFYFMEDRDFLAGQYPEIANVAPDFGVGIMFKHRF
jgi:hypothetical protein